MKITDTLWFTASNSQVGIVLGEDTITGERKAYIGAHYGRDEESDSKLIAEYGAKITMVQAERLTAHFRKQEA